jgi:sortase A
MKVVVRTTSPSLVLKWTQRALFAGAIAMLGYCGFVLTDAWMFQHRESHNLERLLREGRHKKDQGHATNGHPQSASTASLAPGAEASPPAAIGPGGLIGSIEILRLGVSVVIIQGTGDSELRRAAGHIMGTALPGQPGNVGIAGHRDTFFRPLQHIQRNDMITLTTPHGQYRYRVMSTKVVGPYDLAVLDSDSNQILTLVTCYPFYFVGPAPRRFIVRAERVL